MKKRLFFCVLILIFILILPYQAFSDENGISQKILKELRRSINPESPVYKLRLNAISNNKASELVLNTQLLKKFNDFHFSNKIKTKGITNQKSTGRCWLFAGYNILRYNVIKKLELDSFELSENYGMFYDKLEKANLFLEGIINTADKPLLSREVDHWLKNPLPDGGQWNMVVNLVDKYGVVPKKIMPETYNSSNSRTMNRIISKFLRYDATILREKFNSGVKKKKLRKLKVKMLKDVYRLLTYFLGIPPDDFEWRYKGKDDKLTVSKTYTPNTFYNEFINVDLKNYIMLYNAPHKPYYKIYAIKNDKDMADKPNLTFINLPVSELKELTKKSILAEEPVWFGCDVGKDYFSEKGVLIPSIYDYESLLDIEFKMTKKERVLYRASIPTHAMIFTGVDIIKDKPQKWLIENSWGKKAGRKGFLVMKDEWFKHYVFEVVINLELIPEKILDILKEEPVVLPSWDPMFKPLFK